MRHWRLLASGLIVLAILVPVLAIQWNRPPPRPSPPNPNGYFEFVKAGYMAKTAPGNLVAALTREELRIMVTANAEPLRLLRSGLARGCLVPLESAMTNISDVVADMGKLKSCFRLLADEGRLSEMDQRYSDAARSYVDSMRLGNEISRGGLLIHRLVGVAAESSGCNELAKLVPKLSADQCRALIPQLETLDDNHVSWTEVMRNEKHFAWRQVNQRFIPFFWVTDWWKNRQSVAKARTRHNLVIARERLLLTELALRSYRFEHAGIPSRLDTLATNYLSKIPLDPFGTKALVYSVSGTNWLLYSIGPDGTDDGGKPVTRVWPFKGDVLANSVF